MKDAPTALHSFFLDGTTLYYVNNPPCFESTYKITVAKIIVKDFGDKNDKTGETQR